MGRKVRALSFFIKLILFVAFIVCEHRLYTEYKKYRETVEFKKDSLNKKIKNSFLLREEGFYLDKKYLKEYEKLQKNYPEDFYKDAQGGVIFEQSKKI